MAAPGSSGGPIFNHLRNAFTSENLRILRIRICDGRGGFCRKFTQVNADFGRFFRDPLEPVKRCLPTKKIFSMRSAQACGSKELLFAGTYGTTKVVP
jgi:hypothetical protein